MARLIAHVCKELPMIKNARKPARDLWEASKYICLKIYSECFTFLQESFNGIEEHFVIGLAPD